MAYTPTAEDKAAIKKIFDNFDANKDGHISSSEIKTVMSKLGQKPSDEEIAELIKSVDTDKNGTIEFNEFCCFILETAKKSFNETDADGNGYVTPEELQTGFKKLGNDITLDQAKEIVKKIDTDGDGRVSFAEFMKSIRSRPLP